MLESRRVLASLIVDTAVDIVSDTDQRLSLREALEWANLNPGADHISFAVGISEVVLTEGELRVTDSLTIEAIDGNVTVDANFQSRVFNVGNGDYYAVIDFSLRNLSVINGVTTEDNRDDDGVYGTTHHGGGIRFYSLGNLQLHRSAVINCRTEGLRAQGGGIYASGGEFVMTDSLLSGNVTEGGSAHGAGVAAGDAQTVITNSVLRNNEVHGRSARGGGFFQYSGSLQVVSSGILQNRVTGVFGNGGGIDVVLADIAISDSQLLANEAHARGGAVHSWGGDATLTDCIVEDNAIFEDDESSGGGGAIWIDNGSLEVLRGQFSRNSASGDFARGGALFVYGDLAVHDSRFQSNSVTGTESVGGAISHRKGRAEIVSSVFDQNSNGGERGLGGAIFVGATSMEISDSVFTHNQTSEWVSSSGGAIYAQAGDVLIRNTSITQSVTRLIGGGIAVFDSNLTLVDCLVSENDALLFGGGIGRVDPGKGEIEILRSTIGRNTISGDGGDGGGIGNVGDLTVRDSLIYANSVLGIFSDGAGISAKADVLVVNSTISGNRAVGQVASGGAIWMDGGSLTISQSTIVNNRVEQGTNGSFYLRPGTEFQLDRSIVAGNYAPGGGPDGWAGYLQSSFSVTRSLLGSVSDGLFEDLQSRGAALNLFGSEEVPIDPRLAPIANNGGPTMTHALLIESPAIDFAAPPIIPPTVPESDQRGSGFLRLVDADGDGVAQQDLGAYEFQGGVFDYGDAPGPYPVLRDEAGASHRLNSLVLGALIDGDADGMPSDLADSDFADDGVRALAPLLNVAGSVGSFEVLSSGLGKLDAWIDFNGDGDWLDVGEHIAQDRSVVAGTNVLSVTVPAGSVVGNNFARFRLSEAGGLDPGGIALSGEVEDYLMPLLDEADSPIVELQLNGHHATLQWEAGRVLISESGETLLDIPAEESRRLLVQATNDELRFESPEIWRLGTPLESGVSFRHTIFHAGESAFSFETEGLMLWQNPLQVSDINNDGRVTPIDALVVMNEIAVSKISDPSSGTLPELAQIQAWPGKFYDQNGDGRVSPLDALRVINQLARESNQNQLAEAEDVGTVATLSGLDASRSNAAVFPQSTPRTVGGRDEPLLEIPSRGEGVVQTTCGVKQGIRSPSSLRVAQEPRSILNFERADAVYAEGDLLSDFQTQPSLDDAVRLAESE